MSVVSSDDGRSYAIADFVVVRRDDVSPLLAAMGRLGEMRGATVLSGPEPGQQAVRIVYERPVPRSVLVRAVAASGFELVRFWDPNAERVRQQPKNSGPSFRTFDVVLEAAEQPRALVDAAKRALGLAACAVVSGPAPGEQSLQLVFESPVSRSELKALVEESGFRLRSLVAHLEEEGDGRDGGYEEPERDEPRPGDGVFESFGLPPEAFAREIREDPEAVWRLLYRAARELRDLPLPRDERR